MYKTYKMTMNTESGNDTKEKETRRILFRTIFALATALKISPKRLANMFKPEKLDEYALKFRDEMNNKASEIIKKAIRGLGKKQ